MRKLPRRKNPGARPGDKEKQLQGWRNPCIPSLNQSQAACRPAFDAIPKFFDVVRYTGGSPGELAGKYIIV